MFDTFLEVVYGLYNYWVGIALMMIGFFAVVSTGNLVKKLIGLVIFQTSVLLFYISVGVKKGGAVPILKAHITEYMNPLPHVLMLTAIVVGVATLSVGLALAIRIRRAYGTVEERAILAQDAKSRAVNAEVGDAVK